MFNAIVFKEKLLAMGVVTTDGLARAEEFAARKTTSLENALVTLGLTGHAELGRCLSELYRMSYTPLLEKDPPEAAESVLSRACAKTWRVFPIDCDPGTGVLTLAISAPEEAARLERIYRFLMQPQSLSFTIASHTEIGAALRKYYGQKPDNARPDESAEPPKKKRLFAGVARPAPQPAPGSASDEQVCVPEASGTAAAPRRSEERKTVLRRQQTGAAAQPGAADYAEMSRALAGALAFVARTQLANDSTRLQQVASTVRYCQLLASRLGLSAVQSDAVVAAAWLSSSGGCRELIKQLVTPYRLEEIVRNEDVEEDRERVERQILSLVTCYQDLVIKDPGGCRDINAARRDLRRLWSSSQGRQPMLETFLQVLMDEEFLSKLDRGVGRVLIVDPAESVSATFTAPLTRDGYEVRVAPDSEAAERLIAHTVPDVIVSEIELPGGDGLKWCKKIKKRPETSHIPVIMMAGRHGERRAAECLRSGADDFIVEPVDMEVLLLKIQRVMSASGRAQARGGVSGTLKDMSFTDMIQILAAGNRSIRIVLTSGDREGTVFMSGGEIIHAKVGETEGDRAFHELMTWADGEFITLQCAEFPERTIHSSAMSLLMEGALLADEGHPPSGGSN